MNNHKQQKCFFLIMSIECCGNSLMFNEAYILLTHSVYEAVLTESVSKVHSAYLTMMNWTSKQHVKHPLVGHNTQRVSCFGQWTSRILDPN